MLWCGEIDVCLFFVLSVVWCGVWCVVMIGVCDGLNEERFFCCFNEFERFREFRCVMGG